MSWVRIWVHTVFATKNRVPFLTKEIKVKVVDHIFKNAKTKEIIIHSLNGHLDHIHCLVSLNKDMTLSKTMQLIKGESSFWINKNKLTTEKFSWQDDYWAVSVSESHVERVSNYIKNQEEHHAKKSFENEIKLMSNKYGWKNSKG